MPSVLSTLVLTLAPCVVIALPVLPANLPVDATFTKAAAAPAALPTGVAGVIPTDEIPTNINNVADVEKRDLPIVGSLPVIGGLTNSLPLGSLPSTGSLPVVGGILGRDLPVVGSLPVVGGLTNSLPLGSLPSTGSLPVVGGILGRDLPIVGELPVDAPVDAPAVDGLVGRQLLGDVSVLSPQYKNNPTIGVPNVLSRELPVVGSLPLVGGLTNNLPLGSLPSTDSLPVIGGLLGRDLPVVGSLPFVGSMMNNLPVGGMTNGLPNIGGMTKGIPMVGGMLPRDLPVVGELPTGDLPVNTDIFSRELLGGVSVLSPTTETSPNAAGPASMFGRDLPMVGALPMAGVIPSIGNDLPINDVL